MLSNPKQKCKKYEDCPYPLYGDEEFCIFHLSKLTEEEKNELSPEKAKDYARLEDDFRRAFYDLVKEIRNSQTILSFDFRGFIFVTIDLSNSIFDTQIDVLNGFQKPVLFDRTIFQGLDKQIDGWNGFRKPVLFGRTIFQGDVSFFTTFHEKADFSEAKFLGKVDFRWATFSGEADFSRATFSGEAYFRFATFSEKADFSEGTFSEEADFGKARFLGEANFSRATFSGKAYFRRATFSGKADFSMATFSGEAHFLVATFSGEAHFLWAKFSGETLFGGATFSGKAFFSIATFSGEAAFLGAKFSGEAQFGWATFSGEANFSIATFSGVVSFSGAKFSGEADFSMAKFSGEANFSIAILRGKMVFKGTSDEGIFETTCDFYNLNSEPEAYLMLDKVNLKQSTFIDTDIENFVFRDVHWYHPGPPFKWLKFWKPRQIALWDEFENKKVDLSKLEDNYHQLVLNYERKREFDKAMEFRKGEMEVKRKQQGTSKNKIWNWTKLNVFNLHAWYKYLSYYGTSYWRALWALVVILLFFSGVFLFSGFQTAPRQQSSPSKVISYDISLRNPAPIEDLWADYWSAVVFSYSILTLQKSTLYEAVSSWSIFWVGTARIAFYAQGALLLLAIRRRFKQ